MCAGGSVWPLLDYASAIALNRFGDEGDDAKSRRISYIKDEEDSFNVKEPTSRNEKG